jgi:hypothetical protein
MITFGAALVMGRAALRPASFMPPNRLSGILPGQDFKQIGYVMAL